MQHRKSTLPVDILAIKKRPSTSRSQANETRDKVMEETALSKANINKTNKHESVPAWLHEPVRLNLFVLRYQVFSSHQNFASTNCQFDR